MARAAASGTIGFMLLRPCSGTALSCRRLFSLKHGLSLLHEGSAALDVVLALEAGLDQRVAGPRVERLARFQQFAHDALASADRERRVLGNHRAVLEDERFELGDGRHAGHEPMVLASSALNWRPVMRTSRANAGPMVSTRF